MIHDFDMDIGMSGVGLDGLPSRPGARQLADIQGGRKRPGFQNSQTKPEYLNEFLVPGLRSLDEAIKNYFSGVRVPTKDSYRLLRTKIAGGDKSLLIWNDELKDGRVKLPVASINRTSHELNRNKFSPPYLPITGRYLSSRRDLMALSYRPMPLYIDYEMVVWSEHKRDSEYIAYQVMTKFMPVVQFNITIANINAPIIMEFNGMTDASDKEVSSDTQQKFRYEYKFKVEGWLPLPEKVQKTVLGRVSTIELSTEIDFSTEASSYGVFA